MYAQYLAAFWAEIIIQTYSGGGEYKGLCALLEEALTVLGEIMDPEAVPKKGELKMPGPRPSAYGNQDVPPYLLIQTIWRFLDVIGYLPDLDICSSCGRSLDYPGSLFLENDSLNFNQYFKNVRSTLLCLERQASFRKVGKSMGWLSHDLSDFT